MTRTSVTEHEDATAADREVHAGAHEHPGTRGGRCDVAPDHGAGSSERRRRGARHSELRRLAHDLRNALNGVAVNLEVARTRAARAGTDPAALLPFLDTAAQQLDAATRLHKQYTELADASTLDG